jgi:hypothetical protein
MDGGWGGVQGRLVGFGTQQSQVVPDNKRLLLRCTGRTGEHAGIPRAFI